MHIGILPLITGYPNQLHLLFASLLDNALTFTRDGEAPVVNIGVQQAQYQNRPYHRVTVEDNGIGFDNAFSAKIFALFHRLNTQQSGYKGKGIGLAIVQRVMVNHDGLVFARGMAGNGAVFDLYFPVDDDIHLFQCILSGTAGFKQTALLCAHRHRLYLLLIHLLQYR